MDTSSGDESITEVPFIKKETRSTHKKLQQQQQKQQQQLSNHSAITKTTTTTAATDNKDDTSRKESISGIGGGEKDKKEKLSEVSSKDAGERERMTTSTTLAGSCDDYNAVDGKLDTSDDGAHSETHNGDKSLASSSPALDNSTLQQYKFRITSAEFASLLDGSVCEEKLGKKFRYLTGDFMKMFENHVEVYERIRPIYLQKRNNIVYEVQSRMSTVYIRINGDCKLCDKANRVRYVFTIRKKPVASDKYVEIDARSRGTHVHNGVVCATPLPTSTSSSSDVDNLSSETNNTRNNNSRTTGTALAPSLHTASSETSSAKNTGHRPILPRPVNSKNKHPPADDNAQQQQQPTVHYKTHHHHQPQAGTVGFLLSTSAAAAASKKPRLDDNSSSTVSSTTTQKVSVAAAPAASTTITNTALNATVSTPSPTNTLSSFTTTTPMVSATAIVTPITSADPTTTTTTTHHQSAQIAPYGANVNTGTSSTNASAATLGAHEKQMAVLIANQIASKIMIKLDQINLKVNQISDRLFELERKIDANHEDLY